MGWIVKEFENRYKPLSILRKAGGSIKAIFEDDPKSVDQDKADKEKVLRYYFSCFPFFMILI
jgi:hypothetical protein